MMTPERGQAVEGDECGHAAGVRGRCAQLRISAQIIFFSAKGGGGARKGGAGLMVELSFCYSGEKTVY